MDNTNKPAAQDEQLQGEQLQAPKLEAKQLLAAKLLSLAPLYQLPVTLFRYVFLAMDRMLGLTKIEMDKVINLTVPVGTGTSNMSTQNTSDSSSYTTIKLRIYHPSANKPQKTLVYFHGGGGVIGSINTHDRFCRYLAKHSNMNIISVDYRLAPEHKFPIPICDAIEAWNYINTNHQQLNINPQHIGVGGDSAGGYLACILGLHSLQTSLPVQVKVKPAFQFLIYPMVDLQGLTESYRRFNKQLILTRDLMDYFRLHYLHSLDQVTLPLVSPLLAKDISESPKSYILTLGYDPLRDDGIAYAQRLKAAGINTQHQHYNDCMHGFISITKLSARAKQATHNIAMALNSFND
ncbi:alpha/beta hydrolase [Shewanella sp. MEBiC00475]|uniref:alpha/beta hydrolase n=1 Tax=Shewanella sp. MEBiC00475 TaxID=2575361 RepID=UPI0010C0ED1C|nr:alpha/beta hydrolase [Shewanella sp. MEBiC00475]